MTNIMITIPPFPSQDLAKLVLGYLAEEQLMTAYDEFLQASPYLDALRNEYDRIFMTSLKNILAEYRAVKIYVETCKPFILRRKLFQCTNLLEIVKFLVNNVDINKLHLQEGNAERYGKPSFPMANVLCEVCTSMKLSSCICKISQSTGQLETSTLEHSVETTSLADLPGNIAYKKSGKDYEPKNDISHSITSSDQIKDGGSRCPVRCSENLSISSDKGDKKDSGISIGNEKQSPTDHSLLVKHNELDLRLQVHVSNDDLNEVNCSRNESMYKQLDYKDSESVKNLADADVLQDFATESGCLNNKIIVPDSSTSESFVQQTSTSENDNVINSKNISKRILRQPPLLIRVNNEHKRLSLQSTNLRLAPKETIAKSTNSKAEKDHSPKITILSDVKVDNDLKIPPLLKNANALVPMQTLFINGTPAYENPQKESQTFTKDEIMAMPTIILVPASDKTKKTVPTVTQNNMIKKSSDTLICSNNPTVEPLVIDITSNDATSPQISNTIIENSLNSSNREMKDSGLIKTVEVTSISHSSLPKDDILAGLKASTPHILPPTRKSSSTPRRSSHVRVLDFTTPRRILHETLNEQEVKQCFPSSSEIALYKETSSPPINNNNTKDDVHKVTNNSCNVDTKIQDGAAKENKASIKLYNWDSQLRALAYIGQGNVEKSEPTRKSKPNKSKAKASPTRKNTSKIIRNSEGTKTNKSKEKKKLTPKSQSAKTKKKSADATVKSVINDDHEKGVTVVKPTINIISRKKWSEPVETEKSQCKPNNSDVNIDTPELERLSLQNEIGAKLNISDLLETPYKQALYEIQMETPKFLGPDIPGDPLSDVKIMNIPTPRFLNTPKLPQNTPSSYSSRPTDYSSGGSYYKPDDQDYVLSNEILENNLAAPTASVETNKEPKPNGTENENSEKICEGKSRPVRQCRKNVSYNYGTPSNSKVKDADERAEKSSTCSETSINKAEKKTGKAKTPISDKDNIVEKKRESKKKSKKYKSPVKRDTPKAFMKIKPRRTTPVKEVLGKGRKRNSDINLVLCVKSQPKKIASSKERTVCFLSTPVISVPTKSRRKSSTPRKLHCTKRFNSESSTTNSSDCKKQISECSDTLTLNLNSPTQESDNEQQPLRWSDDGSQESDAKTTEEKIQNVNESDDINKIKEYINTTLPSEVGSNNEGEGTLQVDLIKRGFDVETARMIERDLLETSTLDSPNLKVSVQNVSQSISSLISHENKNESASKKSDKSTESDCSTSNNLEIVQDDSDNDELDFSVYECNEETKNYFVYKYDAALFTPCSEVKLKETYSMEICLDEDVEIRLRATPFNTIFEHDSKCDNMLDCEKKRIEIPTSPLLYNTLYTPRKAQCYEIFDSTLASLDTPLKSDQTQSDSKVQEFETVTEIVLEVEKLETDIKLKSESKKRKRIQSGTSDESSNGSKKVKPDTSYLLNSAGIQNIDIESVLSKLHGP